MATWKYFHRLFHLATASSVLLIIVCPLVRADPSTIAQFEHDACEVEIHNQFLFNSFHDANPFVSENGMFELLVRFRGTADGHIALTKNENDSEPLYMIIIGSYNNRFSEIRRTKRAQAQVKINTPGILSSNHWRGFVVRYNLSSGHIWVFPEGSDTILLFWKDPNPIPIKYFGFTTYHRRILQVAFDCRAKDKYSTVSKIAG